MRKTLLLALLLLTTLTAKAQNVNVHDIALGSVSQATALGNITYATPLAGAQVTVCTINATGVPCFPTVPLCLNETDSSCTQTNPTFTDVNGNISFWVAGGHNYLVTIVAPGFNSRTVTYTTPFDPSGATHISGPLTVDNGVLSSFFSSTSPNPATNGVIRLAHTDQQCWLNFAGSSNVCFSVNASDQLLFAGAILPTLAGTNSWTGLNSFTQAITVPAPVNCSLPQVSLGNATNLNSNCAQPTNVTGNAATATALAATPTTCGAGLATNGVLANGNATGCFTPVAIQLFCTPVSMSGNVSGGTGSVNALGASVSCTMPSAGCPCRALIHWNVAVTLASNTHVSFWVTDGTHNFRFVSVNGQTSDQTGASQGMMTPVTYANSAVVTFTLNTIGGSGASYTILAADPIGSGAASGMDVSIFASN